MDDEPDIISEPKHGGGDRPTPGAMGVARLRRGLFLYAISRMVMLLVA